MPYGLDVERLLAATSLAAALGARERLATHELAALEEHLVALEDRRATALARLGEAEAWSGRLEHLRERLDEAMRGEEAVVAFLIETAAAKRAEIARLRERGQLLATAAARGRLAEAQTAVLGALDADARAASDEIRRLMEQAGLQPGTAEGSAWSWPLRGALTQGFGPTSLGLVPPRVYGGVAFAHFHDGIDIAAPLLTPVLAAAAGRVHYVGHVPDGAMIVIVAHDAGLVSLYAHLDDAFALPPVRSGERVAAGDVIGHVGVTGLTTGPHLHFAVRRAAEVLDPLTLLPPR